MIEVWKPWRVRTFNIMMRYGKNPFTPEECIEIADDRYHYRNAGNKFAVELYRAAGLGVYTIYQRLIDTTPSPETRYSVAPMSLETVRRYCEEFDVYLHERLN